MQYLVVLSSRSGPLEKEAGWVLNGVKRKGKIVTMIHASELSIVNVNCLSVLYYHRPEREHPKIFFFNVLLMMHPCIISHINPTSCTILLNMGYLFLFSTCFGHPCAHHQEKVTVSM